MSPTTDTPVLTATTSAPPEHGHQAICRFDDGLAGWSLCLEHCIERIAVYRQADLQAAWNAIETARQRGHWIALLLDYELGAWLTATPQAKTPSQPASPTPLLTALVFEHAQEQGQRPSVLGPATASHPPTPAQAAASHPVSSDETAHPSQTQAQYRQAIEAIRQGIARGDYYQVNHTLSLRLDWPTTLAPEAVYRTLSRQHPVAHAAYICDGERQILSLSPELFVARQGSTLYARPMKGTAPRHPDPVQDQAAAQALRQSEKNRAENLMIVDLLRNDLGRIATPGSVRVPTLFKLEAYPSVWTLTSSIQAEAPGISLASVLQALFPCGSITGAPKLAAMQAIRTLEKRRRGIYCGSIGWLAPDGDFSLNVAIRTIEIQAGQAQFGVGGGIVSDSDADEEWQECHWKTRILNGWNTTHATNTPGTD